MLNTKKHLLNKFIAMQEKQVWFLHRNKLVKLIYQMFLINIEKNQLNVMYTNDRVI